MKKHILITSMIAAFAVPAFAQIAPPPPVTKDSAQIRDDNHDIRPDRVDQRSEDRKLNSNEANDLRHKKIKEMKKEKKHVDEMNRDTTREAQPAVNGGQVPVN